MASVGATGGGVRQGPGAGAASFPSPAPVPGPAGAEDDAEEPAEVSGAARPGSGSQSGGRAAAGRPGVGRAGREGGAAAQPAPVPKRVLLPV